VISKISQANQFYLGTDEYQQDNGHLVKPMLALELVHLQTLHILPILSQTLNIYCYLRGAISIHYHFPHPHVLLRSK
jgi:hypothetical protein